MLHQVSVAAAAHSLSFFLCRSLSLSLSLIVKRGRGKENAPASLLRSLRANRDGQAEITTLSLRSEKKTPYFYTLICIMMLCSFTSFHGGSTLPSFSYLFLSFFFAAHSYFRLNICESLIGHKEKPQQLPELIFSPYIVFNMHCRVHINEISVVNC